MPRRRAAIWCSTVTFSGLSGTRSNVDPQRVDDLTVGAKMQFLDRALTFNVNAFYDRYRQLQTSVFNGTEFLTEKCTVARRPRALSSN